jgi:hypothetical protein
MRGPRKISDLIEGIYDAALEPVGINEFVGGRACGTKDSIPVSPTQPAVGGVPRPFSRRLSPLSWLRLAGMIMLQGLLAFLNARAAAIFWPAEDRILAVTGCRR